MYNPKKEIYSKYVKETISIMSHLIERADKTFLEANDQTEIESIYDYFKDLHKKLVKPERDIIKCECNTCGSSYECRYDKSNDEYICMECLEKEEEGEEEEEDEEEEDEEENLEVIREEVKCHIEENALDIKKDFESFFGDVDVINAYEEEWNDKKDYYKPIYKTVWEELNGNEISK